MKADNLGWRIVFLIALVGVMLAIVEVLIPTVIVLLLLFAGVLFGIFLNGLSRTAKEYLPLSYRWSYGLVVTLFGGSIIGGFYYMGSQIAGQLSELSTQLRSTGVELSDKLQQYDWVQPYLPNSSQMQDAVTGNVLPSVVNGLQSIVWGGTAIVVVLGVGLYLGYDPGLYTNGLLKLIPSERREQWRQFLDKLGTTLGYWIVGRLLSMSIIGVLTSVGLWVLGVPLPLTLGALAALLTFIPNIGPILAAVPQVLLALQVDSTTAIYVLILNLALQIVESYLLTPIIQRYEVMLPPALVIAVQVLMGVIAGLIGVMMAAPLAAMVMVAVEMFYLKDHPHSPKPVT